MLLQTNSYIVPKEKRAEHARLLARFRQTLAKLGCDHFEAYEQVGNNWSVAEPTGRFVQIMRFKDRKHQQAVHAAERTDPESQALIKEFCDLINLPYQQQQGLFASGFYTSVLAVAPTRVSGKTQIPADSIAMEELSSVAHPQEPPPTADEPEPSDGEQARLSGNPSFNAT
jgi:hypothetical protein